MRLVVSFKDSFLLFFLCAIFLPWSSSAAPRSFRMGFSSWPYDYSLEAVSWVYTNIQSEGDIVLEHLEEGVPWNEALEGTPFPEKFQETLLNRRQNISSNTKLVVAISPLDLFRNGLALYRTNELSQPLPEPWASYRLDAPQVQTAFINYAERVISIMQPTFLVVGVEVNLLMRNNPSRWSEYVNLHRNIYAALKRAHPEIPILLSIDCVAMLPQFKSTNALEQKQALKDILPYVDILGLSVHPFLSQLTTGPYTFDLFGKLRKLTKKPLAITETSFPAQSFNLTVNGKAFPIAGSEAKQKNYFSTLLRAAQRHHFRFVIVFSLRDYDALWSKLGESDFVLPWRDTGLLSEIGSARPAMGVWRKYRYSPFKP